MGVLRHRVTYAVCVSLDFMKLVVNARRVWYYDCYCYYLWLLCVCMVITCLLFVIVILTFIILLLLVLLCLLFVSVLDLIFIFLITARALFICWCNRMYRLPTRSIQKWARTMCQLWGKHNFAYVLTIHCFLYYSIDIRVCLFNVSFVYCFSIPFLYSSFIMTTSTIINSSSSDYT